MAKKRTQKGNKARKKPVPSSENSVESNVAEATTVFWMLCLLALTMADIVACIGVVVRRLGTEVGQIHLIFELLSFVAVALGIIQVVTTPLVLRLRINPPPRPIVFFALVAAVLPWGVVLLRGN